MPTTHARLSPSSSDRWMSCPGSIRFCERLNLPASPPSLFAAEGTFAHEIRAKALLARTDPAEFIGYTANVDGFDFVCTSEMADYLRPGVSALLGMMGALHVEVKLDISQWIPGGFGTSDAVLITDRTLVVDDLKYGAGLPVSAVGNKQLRIYALGALALHPEAENIVLNIDQPRTGDGTGSAWTITREELEAFGAEVAAAAALANWPTAPLKPSPKACKWCPAKSACPALASASIELVGFDALDAVPVAAPPVERLTPSQVAAVLEARPMIEAWLEAVHVAALESALAGTPPPGWKAVSGRRGARAWADGEAASTFLETHLGDAAFAPRKLITPTAAEKLLPKVEQPVMAAFVVQADGMPSLVHDDDKRPALTVTAASFDDLPAAAPAITLDDFC